MLRFTFLMMAMIIVVGCKDKPYNQKLDDEVVKTESALIQLTSPLDSSHLAAKNISLSGSVSRTQDLDELWAEYQGIGHNNSGEKGEQVVIVNGQSND